MSKYREAVEAVAKNSGVGAIFARWRARRERRRTERERLAAAWGRYYSRQGSGVACSMCVGGACRLSPTCGSLEGERR